MLNIRLEPDDPYHSNGCDQVKMWWFVKLSAESSSYSSGKNFQTLSIMSGSVQVH